MSEESSIANDTYTKSNAPWHWLWWLED